MQVLPPTYLVVSIVVSASMHILIPLAKLIVFPWNLIGVLPLGAGVALNLVADQAFRKKETTIKPYEQSAAMITSGVFRISRHPMYLGMVLMLTGIAILLGSLSPFLVIAIFAVWMEKKFIKIEEKMMQEAYGDAYRNYQMRVRKWI